MATNCAVRIADPDGGESVTFMVFYDGDGVGDELRALIARDGQKAVHRVFSEQRTRVWAGLDHTMTTMPAYVDGWYPRWKTELVLGYGLTINGDEELAHSADPAYLADLDEIRVMLWMVSASGQVTCRSGRY